jgi:hypothetical protein
MEQNPKIPVERVQLGVRLEARMVKVLKAMAEYCDLTLGELLEDIILHSFEGGSANPFSTKDLKVIEDLKRVYGMSYDTHACYRFVEKEKLANPS